MDKTLIKDEIRATINTYYELYKLPPEMIADYEWDAFYDVIEKHFKAHNIMDEYVNALNILLVRALNYSLLNNNLEFNIDHLIRSVDDLFAFKIYSEEREEIKKEITNKIKRRLELI